MLSHFMTWTVWRHYGR